MPRIPLPPPFATGAFRVSAAHDAGIGEGRLRGRDLGRPFHGIRTGGEVDPTGAYLPLLRAGDRFSHLTAARIWGAPVPDGGGIHVSASMKVRPRGRNVVGHRSLTGATVRHRGLPVSDPLTTFLELATLLDVRGLTAVGDYFVLDPRVLDPQHERPLLTLHALRHGARESTGRGIRTARVAAELSREGVESPMETRLRLLAFDAQLPEPVCGYHLTDRQGRSIGWFDLAWPERRLIVEYDGDQHRTSTAQYEKDILRFDLAHDAGWRVLRVRAHGILIDPSGTRRRLAAAYAARDAL